MRLALIFGIFHVWEEGKFRDAGLGFTESEALADWKARNL